MYFVFLVDHDSFIILQTYHDLFVFPIVGKLQINTCYEDNPFPAVLC